MSNVKRGRKQIKCRHNSTPLVALGLPADLLGSVTLAEIEI